MKTLITQDWLPCERTREALKKRFITSAQYKPLVMQFRKENHEKEVEDANTKFLKLFDKMMGHAVPKPCLVAGTEFDKKRQADINNKSDISKALEVRSAVPDAMSQEDAMAFYMRERN